MINKFEGTVEQRRAVLAEFFQAHATVEVTFTKVDGEIRTMPCTLNEALLPAVVQIVPGADAPPVRVKKVNPAVMSVFCTDKQEWRSFRIENVISIAAKD
jgi:hypothetical protein